MKALLLLSALAIPACATDDRDGNTSRSTRGPDGAHDRKAVFTTQARFQGELLGGLDGADARCAAAARAAGLDGTFRAWLSDLTGSPAQRMVHATVPYELVSGELIAADWADLTDGLLERAIDRDEHGKPLAKSELGNAVWSATRPDGSPISWLSIGVGTTSNPRMECGNWGTAAGASVGVAVGMLGGYDTTEYLWTQSNGGVGCIESMHLYCFEQ